MTAFSRWLAFILALALTPAPLWAQAPVPITDDSGFVVEGFQGWDKSTTGLPGTITEMHTPRDRDLFGAVMWVQNFKSADLVASLRQSTRDAGFSGFKLEASNPIEGAKYLDGQAKSLAIIGTAQRRGKTYRLAAIALYFSWQGSDRATAIHVFAAPEPIYARLGGWVVPASKWFYLNPQTDVADAMAQGSAAPKLQAQRLAGIGDTWGKWVYQTYIQMEMANIQALSNFRKSVVCAGDPNCIIVPAD